MFNTVARVAGVTVLGGLGLFAGYTYLQNRDDAPAPSAPVVAEEPNASTNDIPAEGFSGVPEGTAALPFEEGQTGESVVLDFDDEAPSFSADAGATDADSAPDTADLDTSPPTDISAVETGLNTDEKEGLHTAPVETANALLQEGEDLANTVGDVAEDTITEMADATAHMGSTVQTEANEALTDAGALTGLRGMPPATPVDDLPPGDEAASANAETMKEDETTSVARASDAPPAATDIAPEVANEVAEAVTDDGAKGVAAATVTQSASLQPGMTRNPPQKGKTIGMTRNPVQKDKVDGKPKMIANKAKIDKPDDGPFFTTDAKDTGLFDPCLKSDGTHYEGPGTALNPFAAENPCLPQATAESFDVARSETLPIAESDVTPETGDGRYGLPLQQGFFGPLVPLAPNGSNFGSDYRSLL